MKKLFLLLVLIPLFSLSLKAKKVEAQICFEYDTLNVTIFVPANILTGEIDYRGMQKAVWYVDPQGKKSKFTAFGIKEIRFTYKREKVRLLSRENTLGIKGTFSRPTHVFLKLEIDGYLKLLSTYRYNQASGNAGAAKEYILQKGNEEMKILDDRWFFRRNMRGYFNDCPELAQKIEDKELKERNILTIVFFYNKNCH